MKKKFLMILFFGFLTHETRAQFKVIDQEHDNIFYNLKPSGNVKEVELQNLLKVNDKTGHSAYKVEVRNIRRFSERGNEIEHIQYGSSNILIFRITYDYPNDTTVIGNYLNSENQLVEKTIYKYNYKGQEIETDPDVADSNRSIKKIIYNYDQKSDLTSAVTYYGDGTLVKEVITYNNKNQKNESDKKLSGVNFSSKFSYDSLGYLKSETLNMNNLVINLDYSFSDIDTHGNWLAMTQKHSALGQNVDTSIIKRIITYYQ